MPTDNAKPLPCWQPIETAPKDGISVLVWDSKRNRITVADFRRYGTDRIWMAENSGRHVVPTHWMPLPDPPKEKP